MADSPFIRDVPAARALDAWRARARGRGLPGPAAGGADPAGRGRGPGHRRAGVGHPLLAAVRRGRHGRDRGPRRRHPRRQRDHAGPAEAGRLRRRRHRRPDAGRARRGRHARARPLLRRGRRAARRRAALPACALDRRGREHHRAAAARGPPAAGGGPRRGRGRGRHRRCLVRRRPVVAVLPTGDEVRPIGAATGPGEILDTNSLMLATQAREAGCEAYCLPIEPDDPAAPGQGGQRRRAPAATCSSSWRARARAAMTTPPGSWPSSAPWPCTAWRSGPAIPVVLGVIDGTPVLGAPGYPVSAALTFDIFAEPLLAELEGAVPRRRPRARARLARKLASPLGMDDWVRVRLGRGGRHDGRDAAAPRRRRAHLAGPRRRAAGGAGRAWKATTPATEVEVELLRGLDEIEQTIVAIGSHDLVLDLAASALRADDPRDHPGLLERRLPGRAGGPARRAVPHRRIAPAGPGHRRVHPALPRPHPAPAATSRVIRLVHRDQGLIVAPGNPLGLTGIDDLARTGRALREPPARRRHPHAARPRAAPARDQRRRRRRVRARGAHPPGGGGGHRRRARRRRPGHHGGRPGLRP